ncbi:putative oxidoreductase C2F3.05c like protein [Verticillium longisporum]|uniref:Putative oxidoreductase C2F3.05c like protein n=1 Tax=Verticillium longisporum TaxID=100787 RepID=A0A8I3ARB7_VERLO|nr:putative oxidoreductase C2F3.05c like protein [Verticillium longisporum]
MTSPPPAILSLHDTIPLPGTDTAIPRLGFGVYQTPRSACKQACLSALTVGYRHIDSAQLYANEAEVGHALQASRLPRAAVFLTTKIHRKDGSAARTLRSVRASVRRMTGCDDDGDGDGETAAPYVDLVLVHRPCRERRALWRALETVQGEGAARAVGVSNFGIEQLEEMRVYAGRWPPSVNQIELHPWCQQRALVAYCERHGIVVQAWSPLVRGTKMADPTLRRLGEKHGKTPAQVLVRYSLQKGWVPLVKSTSEARMRENADVFDFALEGEDMEILDGLDQGTEGALCPHLIH